MTRNVFPHMPDDARYPGASSVDTSRYANRFDYTRWNELTKLKLCNVNWRGDYQDVAKFEDDAARDAWFDAIPGDWVQLKSAQRILPDGSVKLPVPFDDAARYNYLAVEFSNATGADDPLAYAEVGDAPEAAAKRRYYFFVESVEYAAPSTTVLNVKLDEWTTFANRVDLTTVMLGRGHAPMLATDPQSFLDNPLANNADLLTDDVSYGEPAITASGRFVPFGNGRKYILFATTTPPWTFDQVSTIPGDPAQWPTVRSLGWNQRTIDGDEAGSRSNYHADTVLELPNPPDYRNSSIDPNSVPTGTERVTYYNVGWTGTTASQTSATPNGYSVVAADASQFWPGTAAYNGITLSLLFKRVPVFLESIVACWIVDESMIELGTRHELSGVALYEVTPVAAGVLDSIRLKTDDFGYPAEYSPIAKLYTFPYAALEVSDSEGNVSQIKIENTGRIDIMSRVSLAYPYIRFDAYLTGVGGDKSASYAWGKLSGESVRELMPLDDWAQHLFGYDFPTFALTEEGVERHIFHNYTSDYAMFLRRVKMAYRKAAHSANTAYQNDVDSNNAALENARRSNATAQANAYRSADAAYGNATRSASASRDSAKATNATDLGNANRTAETAVATENRSARTARLNAYKDAENQRAATTNQNLASEHTNALNITYKLWNTVRVAAGSVLNTVYANGLSYAKLKYNLGFNDDNQKIENVQAGITALSGVASGVTSAVTGAVSNPATAGVAAAGGIVNAVTSAMQGIAAIALGNERTNVNAVYLSDQARQTVENTKDISQNDVSRSSVVMNHSNRVWGHQNDVEVELADVNAANRQTVSQDIADRDYSTSLANTDADSGPNGATRKNAADTNVTANANADRAYDAGVRNADATRSAARANADASKATGDENAAKTATVGNVNADYTRKVAIDRSAQTELRDGIYEAWAKSVDRLGDPPVRICAPQGDAVPDEYGWRGITVSVKTQPLGAISQAGDQMLRYGYHYNRVWRMRDMNDLNVMGHFTYWQCSDLWLVGRRGVPEGARETIRRILMAGTTVWRDPSEIGKVSVYDNWPRADAGGSEDAAEDDDAAEGGADAGGDERGDAGGAQE